MADDIDTSTDDSMASRWYGDGGETEQAADTPTDDMEPRWYGASDEPENAEDDAQDVPEGGDDASEDNDTEDGSEAAEDVSEATEAIMRDLEIDPDSAAGESFAKFAAEHGLDADKAKELAQVELDHRAEYWSGQEVDWRKSSEADPVISSRLPAIRGMVQEYGDDSLVADLGAYASHPGLLRFLARISDELDRR